MTNDNKIFYYLEKENDFLKIRIKFLKRKITNLEIKLNSIKSTKYFHLWRFYCHLKELFKYEK
jgi:chaperonin cofactor prefoldin